MKIRKKVTAYFVTRLVLILFVSLILILGLFVYLSFLISDSTMKSDFPRAEAAYLESMIQMKGNHAIVNKSIQQSVKKKGGWLKILNKDGEMIGSINLPQTLEKKNSFMDNISLGQGLSGYRTSYWHLNKGKSSEIFMMYGEKNKSADYLKDFLKVKNQQRKGMETLFKKRGSWILLYTSNGKLLSGINAPEKLSYIDILNIEKNPWNSKWEIATEYNEKDKVFYVSGAPNSHYTPINEADSIIDILFLKGLGVIFGTLLLLFVFASVWYGRKFGQPLIHMMTWVNNLSNHILNEPQNKKGHYVAFKRFKLFREVFISLENLTETLKRNKAQQLKNEQTREEWISGLSHDLKTPLSSVAGYSAMLETPKYEWSKEEVRKFGKIILDKASYMSDLIEDLNLTYRLKNDAVPIHKELKNLIPIIHAAAEQFQENGNSLTISSYSEEIYALVDERWFFRILTNLIANAFIHNPKDVSVKIELKGKNEREAELSIKDNGTGMSAETLKRLFNRYYRGGNTAASESGSGLGMAISRQLAIAHQWTIIAESKLGAGTHITLVIPLAGSPNCSLNPIR